MRNVSLEPIVHIAFLRSLYRFVVISQKNISGFKWCLFSATLFTFSSSFIHHILDVGTVPDSSSVVSSSMTICTKCSKCGLPRRGYFDKKPRLEKNQLIKRYVDE